MEEMEVGLCMYVACVCTKGLKIRRQAAVWEDHHLAGELGARKNRDNIHIIRDTGIYIYI